MTTRRQKLNLKMAIDVKFIYVSTRSSSRISHACCRVPTEIHPSRLAEVAVLHRVVRPGRSTDQVRWIISRAELSKLGNHKEMRNDGSGVLR